MVEANYRVISVDVNEATLRILALTLSIKKVMESSHLLPFRSFGTSHLCAVPSKLF